MARNRKQYATVWIPVLEFVAVKDDDCPFMCRAHQVTHEWAAYEGHKCESKVAAIKQGTVLATAECRRWSFEAGAFASPTGKIRIRKEVWLVAHTKKGEPYPVRLVRRIQKSQAA